MSVISIAVKHMMDGGMSSEAIVTAVAEMEAAMPEVAAPLSSGALRTARWRANKASQTVTKPSPRDGKRHQPSPTVTNVTPVTSPSAPSPDKEIPPTPPKENNLFPDQPLTPSAPRGASVPRHFQEFWDMFPNKVGKADAIKAFSKAITRTDIGTMLTGLSRYASKADDRPWCNPATWLNQDRWTDQPAIVQARASPGDQARATTKQNFTKLADFYRAQGEREDQSSGTDRSDAGDFLRITDGRP